MVLLEKGKNRATKIIKVVDHLSYEERLKSLGLSSSEKKKDKGDMNRDS